MEIVGDGELEKILCCTVLYDKVKKQESKVLETFKSMNNNMCEFLIIDDYVVNTMAEYDDFSIIKNKKKLDPIKLREVCIEYAIENQFDYFVFCDADDIQLRQKIKVLYETISEYELDYVSHNMQILDKNHKVIKRKMFPVKGYTKIDLKFIADKNVVGLGNSIFKVQSLKNALPLNNKVICDWWIAFNLLLNNANGMLIDDILSYYIQYGDNTANLITADENDIETEYKIKVSMYEALKIKYAEKATFFTTLEDKTKEKYFAKKDKPIISKMNYWWDLLN